MSARRAREQTKYRNIELVSIKTTDDPKWLAVKLTGLSEMSFEIKKPHHSIVEFRAFLQQICNIAPAMLKLDADMMESADGAKVKFSQKDINQVRRFSNLYRFRNINCSLPGFDELQLRQRD